MYVDKKYQRQKNANLEYNDAMFITTATLVQFCTFTYLILTLYIEILLCITEIKKTNIPGQVLYSFQQEIKIVTNE